MRLAWLIFVVSACSAGSGQPVDAGRSFDTNGPWAVGNTHLTIASADGGRQLPVELWYPAAAGTPIDATFAVEDFEQGERRMQLAAWVAEAPEACTPRLAHSTPQAPLADSATPFPLVLVSHCTRGFRFSMHTMAERLASQGFVVAAPDHVDNTRFDNQATVSNAFLAVRTEDLRSTLDALLAAQDPQVPAQFHGRLDSSRVGAIGHSFGAVSVGRLVELDARVKGALLIAAPVDSPFLNSGSLPRITRPLSWLLARDDNSISYLGNGFIRDNFAKAPKPSWLVEVDDTGHWSFSDIAGLAGDYQPGCGQGTRDDPSDAGAFTYLDNARARAIGARIAAAWAAQQVLDDPAGGAALNAEAAPEAHVRAR